MPLTTVETVLRLYQEEYFDFNVRHFHEKLSSEHQIVIYHSHAQPPGLTRTLPNSLVFLLTATMTPVDA